MFKWNIRFIKAAPNGDKTKYWSKQAKAVKKLRARTYLLKSGSKMFKRNIRFIKAAPNGQDMDPPNITQAIKGENDCRPKVQGSNPTDGPMTRSRMKKDRRQTAQSQRHHWTKWRHWRHHCQRSEGGVTGAPTRTRRLSHWVSVFMLATRWTRGRPSLYKL